MKYVTLLLGTALLLFAALLTAAAPADARDFTTAANTRLPEGATPMRYATLVLGAAILLCTAAAARFGK